MKTNDPTKKMAKDLNRHFSKRDIQMANAMKRCYTVLAIREMQIKTKMRWYFTHTRMARMKKSDNIKCWQGCREIRPSYITGGNVKWCTLEDSLAASKINERHELAIPLLGIYLREQKHT